MTRRVPLSLLLVLAGAVGASAQEDPMRAKPVPVIDGERTLEGTLFWDGSSDVRRPGVLMIPNWMGPTPESAEKARRIAAMGYVVLMWDVYGTDVRPQNNQEAGAAAGALRKDRAELRRRVSLGLDLLRAEAGNAPLQPQHMAAIGFCFGGGAVLELARSGANVDAVVSFHGNLDTPDPSHAKQIQGKVLVLHGAKDPLVPPAQVEAFEAEMQAAGVDYELVAFPEAVHSFTNPQAQAKGRAEYHEASARQAFAKMRALFSKLFAE